MLYIVAVSWPANTGKTTRINKMLSEVWEKGNIDVIGTKENARKINRADFDCIEKFQDAIAELEIEQLKRFEELRKQYQWKDWVVFVDRTYKDNVAYLYYAQLKWLSNLSCWISSLNLAFRGTQEYDAIVFAHNPIKEVTNENFKIYDTQEFRNYIECIISKSYKNVVHISNFKEEWDLAKEKIALLIPKIKNEII